MKKIISKSWLLRCWAIFLLFAVTFSVKVNAQTPVQRGGWLKTAVVDGKSYVCNQGGKPFSMAGVDLYWSCWDNKYYNAGTVDYFVDNWKVSVMRCAVGVAYTPSSSGFTTVAVPGGIITDYATNVNKCKAVVNQAIQRGIYVILDWHVEGKASPFINTAKQFYKEMAEAYSAYPNIIYEIYNEPARDGNDQSSINAYDQEMVDYIRQYDKKNLIICGSNTWSQNPQAVVISGPNAYNICYTFHAYPDNEASHLTAFYNNVPVAQANGKAVFITELSGKGNSFGNTETIINKCKEWNIPVTTWEAIDNNEDWSIFCSGSGTSCLTSMGQMFKNQTTTWPLIPMFETVHPTAIIFNPNDITIPFIGASAQLSLAFTPSTTSDQTATYSSSDPSVVSVSATGVVTGNKAGIVTITAVANDKTNGTLTATCKVTVKNLSNVAIGKPVTVSSIETGATGSVIGSNAVDANVSTRWASAFTDPQSIEIDLQAEYKISLVSLNWETAAGKNYTIEVKLANGTWSPISTQTNMANGPRIDNIAVNAVGRYIRMYGTARTTTYGYSLYEFGVYGELNEIVKVTGVSIDPASASVNVTETKALTANVMPSNATNQAVRWSSTNSAIATVDSLTGVVRGVSEGIANIQVKTVDGGFTKLCPVTVTRIAVTGVTLDKHTATVNVSGAITLIPTILPANASNKNVIWTSSDNAKATVINGVVTGVSLTDANKTVVIKVTTQDGNFKDSCSVTVTNVANILKNGDFSQGTTSWSNYIDAAASGSFTFANEAKATINNGGSQLWNVQLYQGALTIENGKSYRLTFDAKAEANRSITAIVEKNGDPYTLYGGANNNVNITTTMANYTVEFTMTQATDANSRVTFNLGLSSSDVTIDNVVLTKIGTVDNPPVVNAGADITVALPASSASLSGTGSDPDGDAITYSWTKVSGGAATITSPSSAISTVTGLVQGVYVFRLTAAANGKSVSDDVQITVSNISTILIQAENYIYKTSAPQSEACSEGGLNMGWIGNGDFMIYTVTVPVSGTYTISYRVASTNTTGKVILGKNGVDLTAPISINTSTGWQDWKTITTTANLTAGTQDFTVYAQTGGFNINWWSLTATSTAKSGKELNEVTSVVATNAERNGSLEFYPNPAISNIVLKTNESAIGAELNIIDLSGKVVLRKTINEAQTDINLSGIKSGLYLVKCNGETLKLIKR